MKKRGRKPPLILYDSPMLIASARSSASISCSVSCPSRLPSQLLSKVLMHSVSTVLRSPVA